MVAVDSALQELAIILDYTIAERLSLAMWLLFMLTIGIGGTYFAGRGDDFYVTRSDLLRPRPLFNFGLRWRGSGWLRLLYLRAGGIIALTILVIYGCPIVNQSFRNACCES